MVAEQDLGKYMIQVCTHFKQNLGRGPGERTRFNFDPSAPGPYVSMNQIAAYIVSSKAGSLAKRAALSYDMAIIAAERKPWNDFGSVFSKHISLS